MDGKSKPLASVAYFKQENPIYAYSLKDSAISYHRKNIKEFFGISLPEFLNLPVTVINELIEATDVISKDKLAAIESLTASNQ